nr:DarB-like antirestriction [Caudoviricetes sp.]
MADRKTVEDNLKKLYNDAVEYKMFKAATPTFEEFRHRMMGDGYQKMVFDNYKKAGIDSPNFKDIYAFRGAYSLNHTDEAKRASVKKAQGIVDLAKNRQRFTQLKTKKILDSSKKPLKTKVDMRLNVKNPLQNSPNFKDIYAFRGAYSLNHTDEAKRASVKKAQGIVDLAKNRQRFTQLKTKKILDSSKKPLKTKVDMRLNVKNPLQNENVIKDPDTGELYTSNGQKFDKDESMYANLAQDSIDQEERQRFTQLKTKKILDSSKKPLKTKVDMRLNVKNPLQNENVIKDPDTGELYTSNGQKFDKDESMYANLAQDSIDQEEQHNKFDESKANISDSIFHELGYLPDINGSYDALRSELYSMPLNAAAKRVEADVAKLKAQGLTDLDPREASGIFRQQMQMDKYLSTKYKDAYDDYMSGVNSFANEYNNGKWQQYQRQDMMGVLNKYKADVETRRMLKERSKQEAIRDRANKRALAKLQQTEKMREQYRREHPFLSIFRDLGKTGKWQQYQRQDMMGVLNKYKADVETRRMLKERSKQEAIRDRANKRALAKLQQTEKMREQYRREHPFLSIFRDLGKTLLDTRRGISDETRNDLLYTAKETAAAQIANSNIKDIDEALHWRVGDRGVVGRTMRGTVRGLTNTSTYDVAGVSEVLNAESVADAANRWQSGIATPQDEDLLAAFVAQNAIKNDNSDALGGMYGAGVGLAENAQFMASMFVNPLSGIGKASAKKAASQVARWALKKFGKGITSKIAVGVAKYGARAAMDLVGAGFGSEMFGQNRIMADAIGRQMGEIKSDGNGGYIIERPKETWSESLYKAHMANAIEWASEMWGEYLPNVGSIGGWLGKQLGKGVNKAFGYDKLLNFFSKYPTTAWAKAFNQFKERTHWDGMIGEYAEEVMGNIANAATVGDMTWDSAPGTGVFNAKVNYDTFLAVALMCGIMSGVNTAGYAAFKYRAGKALDRADSAGLNVLGGRWNSYKDKIDNADERQTKTILDEVAKSKDLNDTQKRIIFHYALQLAYYHGANLQNMKNKAEGRDNAQQNAYGEGRAAKGEDKHEAQNELKAKTAALAQMLNVSEEQLSNMTDEQLESLTGEDDEIDNAIYDYQTSRARMQGVDDEAKDDADNAASEAETKVDQMTDKNTDTVRPAKIAGAKGEADREVYIVSGDLETHEDGSIDRGSSSDMILYYDPQTGQIEHGDASMFTEVGEARPASEVMDEEANAARQRVLDEHKAETDGIVQVGSTYHVLGEDGQTHEYKVLSQNADGTVNVSVDGTQITSTIEQLQELRNQSDEARNQAQVNSDMQSDEDIDDEESGADETSDEIAKEGDIPTPSEEELRTPATEEEHEDNMPYDRIANEQTGQVVPVTVEDEDGAPRFGDAQGVFLYSGKTRGNANDYLGIMVVDQNGKATKYAIKRKYVYVGDAMSMDDYKESRRPVDIPTEETAPAEDNTDYAPTEETAPAVDNTEVAQPAVDETQTTEAQPAIEDVQPTTEAQTEQPANTEEAQPTNTEEAQPTTDEETQTPATDETQTNTEETQTPAESVTLRDGTQIPLRDGNPAYEQMTPEQGADFYHDEFGDDARQVLEDEVNAAEKALKKAKDSKVNGKNFKEKKASQQAKAEAVKAAQQEYDTKKGFLDNFDNKKYDTKEGRHVLSDEEREKMVNENTVDDNVANIIMGKGLRKAMQKIADMMGAKLVFLQTADANGWYDPKTNTVYVALDADKALASVFGHEMTHEIRKHNEEAYQRLKDVCEDLLSNANGNFSNLVMLKRVDYANQGVTLSQEEAEEEAVADVIGQMINDTKLTKNIAMHLSHPILATIHRVLTEIWDKFGISSPEAKRFHDMRETIAQAYVETMPREEVEAEEEAQNNGNQFSLRQKPDPATTKKGYAVFVVKTDKDGKVEKLVPKMLSNDPGAPTGVWLDADTGHLKRDEDGNPLQNSIGRAAVSVNGRQSGGMGTTKKGYAVFVVKTDKDGKVEKLVPKMLSNDPGAPTGVWLDADTGHLKRDEDGNPLQNSIGRAAVSVNGRQSGGMGSNKLSWRPGKHLALYPNASQFAKKNGMIPSNVVFFEVEYAADEKLHKQYQRDAWSYGTDEKGEYNNTLGGLPYIPEDSYYVYRTNQIADGATPMVITGAYKINRALSDDEARKLNEANGGMWFDREGGDLTEDKMREMGLDEAGLQALSDNFDMSKIAEHNDESKDAMSLPGYTKHDIDWDNKNLRHAMEENGQKVDDYKEGDKFSLRLQSAVDETETNPSDAQKESGNYKKGHVKFGGYDFTIENPKGSYRSGKDADGTEWKQKMNDTYGYIRGKFGKDGDHLDMFINDKADLDDWNGNVYVVDQVNKDGSFDEHKVMYGFDSEEDAKKAYLSNYEEGWQGLGNITGVSKETFDNWLNSSDRKTKPFAEYSSIKNADKFSLRGGMDKIHSLGDVSEESIDVDELPKDYAYRETDVNELEDILENGILREIPLDKPVEGITDEDVTSKRGFVFNFSRPYGRSHGGKGFAKGGLWSHFGGSTAGGDASKVVIGFPGNSAKWRVGYHGRVTSPKDWDEIEHGKALFQRFDEDGYIEDLDVDKMKVWVYDSDGKLHEFKPYSESELNGNKFSLREDESEKRVYSDKASVPTQQELGEGLSEEVKNYAPQAVPWNGGVLYDGQKSPIKYSARGSIVGIGMQPLVDSDGKLRDESEKRVYSDKASVPTQQELGEGLSEEVKNYAPQAVPWNGGVLYDGQKSPIKYSARGSIVGIGMQPLVDSDGKLRIVDNMGRRFDKNHPISVDDLKRTNSALNAMVDICMSNGTLTNPEVYYQKYADFLNRLLEKGDKGFSNVSDQWMWEGEALYRSVHNNGDEQYAKSIDITRICKKNESVIHTISELQKRQGYGVTVGQILDIYNQTIEDGYQAPCPVCYVFSRYLRNGVFASTLVAGQRRYGDMLVDPRTLSDKEKKKRVDYWVGELGKLERFYEENKKAIAQAKLDIQNIFTEVDRLAMDITSGKLKGKELEEAKGRIDELDKRYRAAVDLVSVSDLTGYIKSMAIEKKGGQWQLRNDSWKHYPEDVALDITRAQEAIVEFPGVQRYRNSHGSAAGKSIQTASNNDLGDTMVALGLANPEKRDKRTKQLSHQNLLLKAFADETTNAERTRLLNMARKDVKSATVYAAQQLLRGGIRQWSWSDNIERLSPDVFMNLMQVSMVGGALQAYSKQLEGVELVASMNGYVNGSLMGKGKGYREVDKDYKDAPVYYNERDGKYYTLEFDDVVGIEPFSRNGKLGLFDLNKMYDRAGNILVGMNDIHTRAAMADPRVFFIIPWHSSGMTNHILYQFYNYLGVDTNGLNAQDYTKVQEEKTYGADEAVPQEVTDFWEKHNYGDKYKSGIGEIPSGKGKLSAEQLHYRELKNALLMHNSLILDKPKSEIRSKKDLEDYKFWSEHKDWLEEIKNDEFLSLALDKVQRTVNVHGASMTKGDTEFVYPYEYWDMTAKESEADVNGERYMEYCRRLGMRPKFSGITNNGSVDFGNFCEDPGYWKLLIDRRMYDRNGNFQDLTPVTVDGFNVDMVDPEKTKERFDVTRVAELDKISSVVDHVQSREQERGIVPEVDYGQTLKKAVDKYNKSADNKFSLRGQQMPLSERVGQYDAENGTELERFFSFLERGRKLQKGERIVFHVGNSGNILQQYGIKGDIYVSTQTVNPYRHTKNADHGLTSEEWMDALESMNEPLAITKYGNGGNGFRIYTYAIKNGKSVCLGVDVRTLDNGVEITDVTDIKTAFGRDIEKAIRNEKILYPEGKDSIEKIRRNLAQSSPTHNSQVYEQSSVSGANIDNSSETSKENGEKFSLRGNKGYVGKSKSVRAVNAENRGLRPKSRIDADFADEVRAIVKERTGEDSKITLSEVREIANKVKADEWHHTGVTFNRTDYYSPEAIADYITAEDDTRTESLRSKYYDISSQMDKISAELRPAIREKVFGNKSVFVASNGLRVEGNVNDVIRGEAYHPMVETNSASSKYVEGEYVGLSDLSSLPQNLREEYEAAMAEYAEKVKQARASMSDEFNSYDELDEERKNVESKMNSLDGVKFSLRLSTESEEDSHKQKMKDFIRVYKKALDEEYYFPDYAHDAIVRAKDRMEKDLRESCDNDPVKFLSGLGREKYEEYLSLLPDYYYNKLDYSEIGLEDSEDDEEDLYRGIMDVLPSYLLTKPEYVEKYIPSNVIEAMIPKNPKLKKMMPIDYSNEVFSLIERVTGLSHEEVVNTYGVDDAPQMLTDEDFNAAMSKEDDHNKFSLRQSYDDRLSDWKKRNGLAPDEKPMDKPQRLPNESIGDYMVRMANYAKNQALWKTAPRPSGYMEALEKWKQDNGIPADEYRPSIPRKADYATEAEYLQARDKYKQEMDKWKGAPKASDYDLSVDLDQLSSKLTAINAAMINQRSFDRQTIDGITEMVKMMLALGWGDNMTRGKIGNLLVQLKKMNGNTNAREVVSDTMSLLADNYIRNLEAAYKKMTSNKGVRKDSTGVIKIGSLDAEGQALVDEHNKVLTMADKDVDDRESELLDAIANGTMDANLANARLEGIRLARIFRSTISTNAADIDTLKQQISTLDAKKNKTKAERELLLSLKMSLTNAKIERAKMYLDMLGEMGGRVSDSKEGARKFRERMKNHRKQILDLARQDMGDKDATEMSTDNFWKKFLRNPILRTIMSPTATFEQMLKFFGMRTNVNGEGGLYNYFIPKWHEAADTQQVYNEKNQSALDQKVKELFPQRLWTQLLLNGHKDMKISFIDLIGKESKAFPGMDIEVNDLGNTTDPKLPAKRKIHLKQGQMLYIYLVNKEVDGAMKLRAMGITEQDVADIEYRLNGQLKALGDWLQQEYLPECQRRYQETHIKYFGAPMADVENYFPLVINPNARHQSMDVGNQNSGNTQLSGTTTGAIVTRRVNVTPLDIENADALAVAWSHLQEMEEWSAMLPFRQDVNTLLSSKNFRNQVKNISSIAYGNGEDLWKRFVAVSQIAAGTYEANTFSKEFDKTVQKAIGLVSMAKISGRLWTAAKQTLSFPAFLPEVGVIGLPLYLKNFVTFPLTYIWARKSMPLFRKRVDSLSAGDPRIIAAMDAFDRKKNFFVKIGQMGMFPNVMIDAFTCAVGAKTVYDVWKSKYIRLGYPEARAEEKAMLKASLSYNKSQQSSENAFLSTMQVDRTYLASTLSLFKNSNYAYGRNIIDAARGLANSWQLWGKHKNAIISSMTAQIQEEEGFDEDVARMIAKNAYNNAVWHNVAVLATYGALLPILWQLGSKALYLILGDDDDKKKHMLEEAAAKGLATSVTDDYAIPFASNLINAGIYSDEEGVHFGFDNMKNQNLYVNPTKSDIANILNSMAYGNFTEAEYQSSLLIAQAFMGLNPATLGSFASNLINAGIYSDEEGVHFGFDNMKNQNLYVNPTKSDIANILNSMAYGNFTEAEYQSSLLIAQAFMGLNPATLGSVMQSFIEKKENADGSKKNSIQWAEILNAPESNIRDLYMDELGLNGNGGNGVTIDEVSNRYGKRQVLKNQGILEAAPWNDTDAAIQKYQARFEKRIQEYIDNLEAKDPAKMKAVFNSTTDPKMKAMIAKSEEKKAKEGMAELKKPKAEKPAHEQLYESMRTYDDMRFEKRIQEYIDNLEAKDPAKMKAVFNSTTDPKMKAMIAKSEEKKAKEGMAELKKPKAEKPAHEQLYESMRTYDDMIDDVALRSKNQRLRIKYAKMNNEYKRLKETEGKYVAGDYVDKHEDFYNFLELEKLNGKIAKQIQAIKKEMVNSSAEERNELMNEIRDLRKEYMDEQSKVR